MFCLLLGFSVGDELYEVFFADIRHVPDKQRSSTPHLICIKKGDENISDITAACEGMGSLSSKTDERQKKKNPG